MFRRFRPICRSLVKSKPSSLNSYRSLFNTTINKAQTESTHVRIPDQYEDSPSEQYPRRSSLQLGDYERIKPKDESHIITITVKDRDGEDHIVKGKINDNLMFLMQEHDIEIEGACEASLACCTCHVYIDEDKFDEIHEPEEDEDDMLDLAPFLQENSRLGCQVLLHKKLEGMKVEVPSGGTVNFYVDGHVPHHH